MANHDIKGESVDIQKFYDLTIKCRVVTDADPNETDEVHARSIAEEIPNMFLDCLGFKVINGNVEINQVNPQSKNKGKK
jgi:hypothetical protein